MVLAISFHFRSFARSPAVLSALLTLFVVSVPFQMCDISACELPSSNSNSPSNAPKCKLDPYSATRSIVEVRHSGVARSPTFNELSLFKSNSMFKPVAKLRVGSGLGVGWELGRARVFLFARSPQIPYRQGYINDVRDVVRREIELHGRPQVHRGTLRIVNVSRPPTLASTNLVIHVEVI